MKQLWQQMRWQLIFSFLLLTVLPLSVVSGVILRQTDQQIRQQAFGQLESVIDLKASQVNTYLLFGDDILGGVQHGQAQFLIENALRGNLPASNNLNSYLNDLIETQQVANSIFIYDLEGRVVAASDIADVGKVLVQHPFFEHSLLFSKHIQPPYYDVGRQELVLVLSQRILRNSGEVIGVAALRLDIHYFERLMLDQSGMGKTGETYMVSSDNNYLLTPSRFEGYDLNRAYYSEGIDAALSGKNGQGVYHDYRGVRVVGVYRWLPDLQVGLIAEMDESEISEISWEAFVQGSLLTLFFILGAVILALYIATHLTRPIQDLTRASSALASGDLQARVKATGGGEIGQLGQSFNSMASQLEQTIEDLRIATEKAQEAARLKSEFLATMSHELRTPMNAILGFTGIILEGIGGTVDKEARHMLERIDDNGQRLLRLINEVLDLAKIESGRVELITIPFDPHKLTQKWYDQNQILAAKKGLDFHLEMVGNLPPTLYGDPDRVDQVAKNLLSNALKFTHNGKITLKIETHPADWQIIVEDTGIGIAPHALNYIFDEFRQADQSSHRAYGGTGLGLAISRNLCRLMGGNIHVESQVGEGSKFIVTLPLKTEK